MKLQTLQPHPSISSYVHNIVVLEADDLSEGAIIPLIAKGFPSVVFQTTGSGRFTGGTESTGTLVLYGQNIQPFEFHATRHLTIIAYFIYPHLLQTFFGFSANEVTNLSLDLSPERPAKKINLGEQLLNASSLSRRLELMNRYVLQLAEGIRTGVNNTVLFATKAMQKSNGLLSLKQVQQELKITERSFQRLFEFHVGVSPKTFCRICQFQSSFQQLVNGQFIRLSDIAYENGYADQSHLIRAFKEFTNCSPATYLRLSAEFQG